MDILRWLAGGKCLKVQSFGGLDYFRAECAPEGAALYCLDGCGCKEGCPYDAEKIYITAAHSGVRSIGKAWPCRVVAEDPTEEALYDALRASAARAMTWLSTDASMLVGQPSISPAASRHI